MRGGVLLGAVLGGAEVVSVWWRVGWWGVGGCGGVLGGAWRLCEGV